MDNSSKPGWKTTEFWLTILTQVPTVLGLIMGASNPVTIGIGAAATIAYTLCRGWNKANGQSVALAALKAGAEAAQALPAADLALGIAEAAKAALAQSQTATKP